MLYKAEWQLKKVVRLCADMPGRYQAEEHLKVAQEELANSKLLIALFYLKKLHYGKGENLGALSRLKDIIHKYPQYSKLDQVLALLGQINVADGNLVEAATYYQRIIRDYPGSQYVGEASMGLSAIDVLRIDRRPSPTP